MATSQQKHPNLTRFDDAMRALPDCVLEIDIDSGQVFFSSEVIAKLTGLSLDQCSQARNIFDLQPTSNAQDWRSNFQNESVDIQLQIVTPVGSSRWLNLRGVTSGRTEQKRFYGVLSDQTEKIERQHLADTLIDSVAISGQEIFVFDIPSERLAYINTTAETNLYYKQSDLQKLPLSEYYQGGTEALLEVVVAIEAVGSHESRHILVRQDGSEYELVANCILQGADLSQLVLVGRDQTSLNRLRRMEGEIRDRYRRALEGSETDIWEWDIRNDLFKTTPAVSDWLGVPAEEFSGNGDAAKKFIHPADLDRFEQVVTDAIFSQESEYLNEYRLIGSSQQVVWVQARGKLQRDERGRATMLSGTATNITERKQAQKDLQNQISTLAAVLDNIADGIIAVNGTGEVTMSNPKAVSILRRSRQELMDNTVLDFFQLRDMEFNSWSSVADGAMREAELVDGHGRIVPIEFAVSEARLVEQDLHIVVFRDIAGRKRFEREILYAKERAEYAAKAKTDFLATMSHEIRTPLNGIMGMAQLLLDTGLNPEQFETASVIHSSGEALLTIINDILDFSKIDAGKLEVESELFDLRTAISEVMDIVQSKSEDGGVPLLLDYPLELSHRLYGDAGRIKQVLLNLMGNAAKFTEQGFIKVSVQAVKAVTDRQDWQRFEISVEDTGIGVAKEMHDQLFESFRQADVSTTRRYGGTGLGLAICKQLVELMGGEIGLESELGSGTRFWFRVSFAVDEVRCNPILSDRFSDLEVMVWHPDDAIAKNLSNKLKSAGAKVQGFENIDQLSTRSLQKSTIAFLSDTIEPEQLGVFKAQSEYLHPVLLTSIGSKRKSLHQTSGSVRYLNLPIDDRLLIAQLHRNHEDDVSHDLERELPKIDRDVFDGLRILLAEDNVVNQKVIERMLTKQGCRVDVAENGLDAVNMSDSEEYDLIFMDLRMPDKDGIEAVMDIRRRELRENLSRIPIVAMTANAMGGDRDACIDAGMDDYVSKPVQIATLTEVLERWAKIN